MNPNYKLCACLTEKNIEQCIKEVTEIKTGLIEHRIDFMKEATDFSGLEKLYSMDKEFIATCRNTSCDGRFEGNEENRIAVLISAIDAGADYIDIEVETESDLKKKLIKIAKKKGCKVIVSMHDYEKTPTKEELITVMNTEREDGADIGKIVTMAKSTEDSHRVLELIFEAQKNNFPMVAFSMGEHGTFSRVASVIYGSPFTFVSNNEASAPGQISFEKMKSILEVVG